jgi:hypothetical protein
MVYIELLAKENLEDEDLFDREPGCHDNLCNSTSRIHDSRSPFTTELLRGHDAVHEESESMGDPDSARGIE